MSLPFQQQIEKDGFRLRGLEVTRIDSFSDVVFGFALTLLVVSLEVPHTFSELHNSLRGFFPFAVCFTLLMLVWLAHYKYFRRFGTRDSGTIVINACLLFVILFYVYPLKFLFSIAVFSLLGSNGHLEGKQITELMLLFGAGFAAIYFLIAALYANAWRQREHLDLTPSERILTRSYIAMAAGTACVGLLSCLVAMLLPSGYAGYAGWTFLLISVYRILVRKRAHKHIARL